MVRRAVFRVYGVRVAIVTGLSFLGSFVASADMGKSPSADIYKKDISVRELSEKLPDAGVAHAGLYTKGAGRGSYRRRKQYRNGYEERKARISPYSGPELSLPQINTGNYRKEHPEMQVPSFEQLTRTGSARIFSKQVLVRRKMVSSPYYNLKLHEKAPECAKPYSNQTEAEYAAILNGLPLIIWLNENGGKKREADPNTLFSRSREPGEDVTDYGIVVESEPEDLDIGVSVSFY